MRRLLPIFVLVVAFSAAGAKPAAACPPIPGIQQVCELVTGSSLLEAVKSRVQIYVETMLYTLKLESNKKYSQTVALLNQKGRLATGHRDDERQLKPAVPGVRCVLPSAMVMGLQGRVLPIPTTAAIEAAVPPSQDGGKSTSTSVAAIKPLPPSRDSAGEPVPNDKAIYDMDTGAYDFPTFVRATTQMAARASNDRRQNRGGKSTNDKYADVRNQFSIRMNNYDKDQPLEMFQDADINANTLLQHDTLPGQTNTPKTGGTPITMYQAALDYCKNLTDPTILDPNRGAALGQDTARQAHAVERAGWDARLSLASTICQEAAARRLAKTTAANGQAQGLAKIAQDYRTEACKNDTIKKSINCDTNAKFSQFEMEKTLYSRLLPSMQGAGILGAASGGDALFNLLSVDQMAVTLNFEIYEMQEKLNLIKAAQLAQIVENTRSGPSASAPKQ